MNTMGRIGSYISRGVYTVSGPFHPFGGAVDIIVVEQPDGSFKSSPWYVRFGKFQGVLKTKEKVVSISVDGVEADFHMYLDHKGEAYFLKEVDVEEGESVLYPSSSGDETDGQSNSNRKPVNSESFNFDADKPNSPEKLDANNTKVVARTGSRRAKFLGLVFGRRSMKEDSYRGEEGDASMLRLSSLERAEIAADLLEMKWSTNLASDKSKKDNASRFPAPDMLDDKIVKNMEVKDEKTQVKSPVNDDAKNRTDDSMSHGETVSRNEQMGSCSVSGSEILESSAVEATVEISCIDTMERLVETSTLGESALEENCGSGSEILKSSAVEASVEISCIDTMEQMAETSTLVESALEENCESGSEILRSSAVQARVEISCIDTMEQVVETSTLVESALEENCDSGSEILRSSAVQARVEISCIDTIEQVVETSTLGESALEENFEIVSEISRTIDEFGIGNADQACPDSQIQYELEACHQKQSDEEQTCDEKDVTSPGFIVSKEGGSDRVQSFVYCETSERSIVRMDGSNKQTQETLYLASAECGEVHVHVETVHVTTELLSKDTDVKQAKHIVLEKEPVEVSDKMNPAPCMFDYNETDIEDSLTVPESCAQVVNVDALCSTEEVDLQNICTTLNVNSDVRDEIKIMDDLHQSLDIGDSKSIDNDIVLNESVSHSPVESLEEEQFLFGDLDEFKFNEARCVDSTSSACLKEDNKLAHCVEGIKEVNGSVNANDESCSSSDMFVQHNTSIDLEDSMEISRVISSPIIIPRSHKAGEEVGRLVESLPNMWSPTIDLGADDCHCPLSHSLDSNSKSLNWKLVKENDSSSMKLHADKELQLAEEQTDIENSQELKSVLSTPTVEISLCKHLLYEGMGANAAAQAFDAEKLDVDKFTSLGPVVLKNDRLVVRIGGHYFPWDVAAPFVLGIVAFGIKEIFELKGMIPVDQVVQTLIGDPSKTIVPSGGSWRLWPFSFRRSRSRKAMQPLLNDTKISDAEVASESINGMNEAKNVCKPRMAKKMIRAITPTSEQLASLNLKEGRNTVTFTFSTAMLGKQQVDARIYLWKWNTRIVISDVDGTITKSDVLGQFMPLVGIDWSQTGVAHLFSAIKENGYQLLFLSARAISQAYHTRQFLFNLKQDGKALPDGPVVISPDGVFPSLFREVIRRAPHEFKISCLEDIKVLFPSDCNPFYAGFGNRDTDEISYLKVGIPRGKIFIINPKGEVAVSRRVDTKSYSSLHALVHDMFPSTISSEQEDFNSWNYWKLPPPDIDV